MDRMVLTLALTVLLTPSYGGSEQKIYSLTEKGEVIVELSVEEIDLEIRDPQYVGLKSPVDALQTFFYHAKQDDLRRFIEMHSHEDGSARYIKDQLYRNRKAFNESDNLAHLKINRIYKWGKHNIVDFEIFDKESRHVTWFEDFICTDGRCEKSNYLNIFGRSDSRVLFSAMIGAARTEIENYNLDQYLAIDIPPNVGIGEFPLKFYYKISAPPSSGPIPAWYDMLMAMEDGNLKPLEKITYLESYIPTIFNDWEESDLASIRYSGFRADKDYVIQNLGVTSNLDVESFFENSKNVWIFFSTLNYQNEQARHLFLFDKETNLFQLDLPVEGESKLVDRLIRNRVFEAAVFSLEQESNEPERYKSTIDDSEIENFVANMNDRKMLPREWTFYIVMMVTGIGMIGLVSCYIWVNRKYPEKSIPGFRRKRG